MTTRWLAMCWGLALASCRFDPSVNGARVHCESNAECPPGLVCELSDARCVASEVLDDTAPAIVSSTALISRHAENPLVAPTALGPLSTLVISVVATEALSEPPTLQASGVALSCVLQRSDITAFSWGCTVDSSAQPGTAHFSVTMRDRVLNQATAELPLSVEVILGPPAPADGTAGHLVLRDSPWGDAVTRGVPSLQISAAPATFTGATHAQIFGEGVALKLVPVDSMGGFDAIEITRVNSITHYDVRAVDAAGNSSTPTPVRDVHWFASFSGKIGTADYPNPHRFQTSAAQADGLEGFGLLDVTDSTRLALPDGASQQVVGSSTWSRRGYSTEPKGLSSPAATYDPLRSKVVRFGGKWNTSVNNYGYFADSTWEWNGREWLGRSPTDPESDGDPPPRSGAAFVWSWADERAVLFGGENLTELNDAWAWNGKSWQQLASGPKARTLAMAFTDAEGHPVIAGGLNADALVNDAWVLRQGDWHSVELTTLKLPLRAGAAVATDRLTNEVWVFGGNDGNKLLADLWRGRGNPLTFEAVDAGVGPSARWLSAAAFDSQRHVLVLFGGMKTGNAMSDELWEFDGSQWAQRTASGPSARSDHQLVYDTARHMTVLFGHHPLNAPEETWGWSGSSWARLAKRTLPPSLSSAYFVWDPSANALVTVGEASFSPVVAQLGAQGWSTTPAPSGLATNDALVTWDVGLRATVVVSSASNSAPGQLWVSDRDGGWLAPTTVLGPDAGALAGGNIYGAVQYGGSTALVAHPNGQSSYMLLRPTGTLLGNFTGTYSNPVACGYHDDSVVLGGLTSLLLPARSSIIRAGVGAPGPDFRAVFGPPPLVWDTASDLVVMPGIRGILSISEPAQSLTDAGWQVMPIADPENDGEPSFSSLSFPGVGYEPKRGVVVLIDRSSAAEVWELSTAHQKPQLHLRYSLEPLPKDRTTTRIALRVTTGASASSMSSADNWVAQPGVSVLYRSLGAWVDASTTNAAPHSSPVETIAEFHTPQDLRALMAGTHEIVFALRPLGENGHGSATIAVDAAELELDYRLP